MQPESLNIDLHRNLDAVHIAYKEKLRSLEAFYREQVRQQQIYVEDLKQQILALQIRGERELDQDQELINEQIKENHQSLAHEEERLLILGQKRESAVQTESKLFAEAEVQNTVGTHSIPSPEGQGRKRLVQLELLHRHSIRKAERNIRRKRVKLHLEKIDKKQKLLQAKKTLQQLEAVCWLSEERLKLFSPKNESSLVTSCNATLHGRSVSLGVDAPRNRSHSFTLANRSSLKIIDPPELSTSLDAHQRHKEFKTPRKSLSVECLSSLSRSENGRRENVNREKDSSSPTERTLNKRKNVDNAEGTENINEYCSLLTHPILEHDHCKMEKAKGRQVGPKNKPANSRDKVVPKPFTTVIPARKSKTLGDPSPLCLSPLEGASNLATYKKNSKDLHSHTGPSVKEAKKIATTVKPQLGRAKQMKTVKTGANTSIPPGLGNPAKHQDSPIPTSSAGSIKKMNTRAPLHQVNKKWHSAEVLAVGVSKVAPDFLQKWQEDDESEPSDTESFYSVDSLSSAYANALVEKLKQEDLERNVHVSTQDETGSDDSEMSQDSLVEKKTKPKRNRRKTLHTLKNLHGGPDNSVKRLPDQSTLPLGSSPVGSGLVKKERSFSMDSLADAEEVPESESADEMPAEIFWKLQSPRLSVFSQKKDIPKPDAFENYAVVENNPDASSSFYLDIKEEPFFSQSLTPHLKDMEDYFRTSRRVCDKESKNVLVSPLVFTDVLSSVGSKSGNCSPQTASDSHDGSPESSFGSVLLSPPTLRLKEEDLKDSAAEEPFLFHLRMEHDQPLCNPLKTKNILSSDASVEPFQGNKSDTGNDTVKANPGSKRSSLQYDEFGDSGHCSTENTLSEPLTSPIPSLCNLDDPSHCTFSAADKDFKVAPLIEGIHGVNAHVEDTHNVDYSSTVSAADCMSQTLIQTCVPRPDVPEQFKVEQASPEEHALQDSKSNLEALLGERSTRRIQDTMTEQYVSVKLDDSSAGGECINPEATQYACVAPSLDHVQADNKTDRSLVAEGSPMSCDDSPAKNIEQYGANFVAGEGVNRFGPAEVCFSRKPDNLKFHNNELNGMERDNCKALASDSAPFEKLFSTDRAKVSPEVVSQRAQNYDGCKVRETKVIDQAEEVYEQEKGETAHEKITELPVCESTNSSLHSGERRESYSDCTLPRSYLVNHMLQSNNNNKNCPTHPTWTDELFKTNPGGQTVGLAEHMNASSHSKYFSTYNVENIKHVTEAEGSKQYPSVDLDQGFVDVLTSSTCKDTTDTSVHATHKKCAPAPTKHSSVQVTPETDFHCAVTAHHLRPSSDITSSTVTADPSTRDNDTINRVKTLKNERPLLHDKEGEEAGFHSQDPTEFTEETVLVEKDNAREETVCGNLSQSVHDLQKGSCKAENEPEISEHCALIGNIGCGLAEKSRDYDNASSDSNRVPHPPPANPEELETHIAMPSPSPHKQEKVSEITLRQCTVIPRDSTVSLHNIPFVEVAEQFSETINCKKKTNCSASPRAENNSKGNDGLLQLSEGLCSQKQNKATYTALNYFPDAHATFGTSLNLLSSSDTLDSGIETIQSHFSARKGMESNSSSGLSSTGLNKAGSLPGKDWGEENREHVDSEHKICQVEDLPLSLKASSKMHRKNIPCQIEMANEHCTRDMIEHPHAIAERITADAQRHITPVTSIKELIGGPLVIPSELSTGINMSSQSACKVLEDKRPITGTNNMRKDICGNRSGNMNKTAADTPFKIEDFKCGVLKHAVQGDDSTVNKRIFESVKGNSTQKENTHLVQRHQKTNENLKKHKNVTLRNNEHLIETVGTTLANNEMEKLVTFNVSHDYPVIHRTSDIYDNDEQVFKTNIIKSAEETADLTDLVDSHKPWVLPLETPSHSQSTVCDAVGLTNENRYVSGPGVKGITLACSETVLEEEVLITPSPTAGKKWECNQSINNQKADHSVKNINQSILVNAADESDPAVRGAGQQQVQCDFLLMVKSEESTCEQPANGKQKFVSANQITEQSLQDANVAATAKTTSDQNIDKLVDDSRYLQDTIPVHKAAGMKIQSMQTSAKMGIKYPATERAMLVMSEEVGSVFDQVGYHIFDCLLSDAESPNSAPFGLEESVLELDTKESALVGKEFLRSARAMSGLCECPVNQSDSLATHENVSLESTCEAKLQTKSKLDSSNMSDFLQLSAKQITVGSNQHYQTEERKHLEVQFEGEDEMDERAGFSEGHTKTNFEGNQVQDFLPTSLIYNMPTNALSTGAVRSCEQDDSRQQTSSVSDPMKASSLFSQVVSQVNKAILRDTPHDHKDMSQINETLTSIQIPLPHESPVESHSSFTQKRGIEVAELDSEPCSNMSDTVLSASADCQIVKTSFQSDVFFSEHLDLLIDQNTPKENLCSGYLDSVQIATPFLNSSTSNNNVPPTTTSSAQIFDVGVTMQMSADENRLLKKEPFTSGSTLLSSVTDASETDLTLPELPAVNKKDMSEGLAYVTEESQPLAASLPPTEAYDDLEQNSAVQKSRVTGPANEKPLMSLESIVRSGKLPSVQKVLLDARTEQQKPLIIRNYADSVVQVCTGSQTNAFSEMKNLPSMYLANAYLDCGSNYGIQKVQGFCKGNEISDLKDCDCTESNLHSTTNTILKYENPDNFEGKAQNIRVARQSQADAVGKKYCKVYRGLVASEAGEKAGNDDHKVAKDIEKKNILKSERLKSSSTSKKKNISCLSESSSVCAQNEANRVSLSNKLTLDAVQCTKGENEARQQTHTLSDPSIVLTSNSEHIANALFRSLQDLNMSVEPPSPTNEDGLLHFELSSEIKPRDFAQDEPLPCHQQKATQTQSYPMSGEIYSQACFGNNFVSQSSEFSLNLEAPARLDGKDCHTEVHLNVPKGEIYQKIGGVVKRPKNQQVEALSCVYDNKDVMHFGSSDINPYTHQWQQEEHCRIGWKQYVFGSASDVSSQPVPQSLDEVKAMRCSSVDNGLNAQHSPFHSHLSSYVKAISSTLSSIEDSQGWDDESENFEPTYSSEGVKHYYPLPSEVIITKPEDGVSHFESPSRIAGNNSGQVDEIVLLYPSESESSEKTEKTMCEQGTQTANNTRLKRLARRQQSYVDVSKSKSELGRRSVPHPASLASMQNLSLHLSQLLHDTSEILGNLTQQRLVDERLTADGNQRIFSEKKVRTYLADNATQTTSDQGIQTDFPLVSETTDQENQDEKKHDDINTKKGSSEQIGVNLDMAEVSDQRPDGKLPIHNERISQNRNFIMPSLLNLSHDAHSNVSHDSLITQTSFLRSSTPLVEVVKQTLSNSQQTNVVFSPLASPVASLPSLPKSDESSKCSVALSSTYHLGYQSAVTDNDGECEKKVANKKISLVDRASSPILTLAASPNTSSSCHSVSDALKLPKDAVRSHRNKKKQVLHSNSSRSLTDSSMDSSSQTETDSSTNSSQRGKKVFTKSALPCRKLDKKRVQENIPCEPKLKNRTHHENNGKKEADCMEHMHPDSSFDVIGQSERERFDQHAEDNIPLEKPISTKYPTMNELHILAQAEEDFGSSDSLFVKQYPESVDRFRRMSSSFEDSLHSRDNSKSSFGLQHSRNGTNTQRGRNWEKKERVATIPPQAHNTLSRTNANSVPVSTSGTSDMTMQLPEDDSASVAASECNTDVLLNESPITFVNSRPRSYSLRDLPVHNKFSNWSGVQQNSLSPRSIVSSATNSLFEAPTKQVSQHDGETQGKSQLCKSKAKEIEMLRRERAQVMSGLQLEMNPHHLTVELAEAKLSYGIGETDALLRVMQSGKGETLNSVSMKQKLYERHMKSIEALRKEREERLQSFRRSRSLSPQKHLSLSLGSLTSPRDMDLPSRRREYLQQLRKDVVDNTRIQEPKRRTSQCPSEIEVLLRDYQRAREEAKTEIARARDKLRERAEQEKRRLHQQMVSHLVKEESKMKTLVSTSTLCTGSSLSLSSGPTSGYNSCNTMTYAASKHSTSEGQAVSSIMDDSKKNVRGRSSIRNSQLYVLGTSLNNSDPEGLSTGWESRGDQTPQSGGSSPRSTRGIELSFKASPPSHLTSYRDLAKNTLANATAGVMTACSYNLGNLFKCQATGGWKYQFTDQDIMVYYKAYPSATRHGFLGAGIIWRPLQSVWAVVKDPSKRCLYDKTIATLQVHKRVSSDIQLVYLMSDMSQCFLNQPRDFCCVCMESKEERWFTVAFQSVYDESLPRPSKDTVRGEILPSAWIMQPDTVNGKDITRVIYSVEVELGAPALPARVLSTISKQQPLVIASLANFLSG